MVYRRPVRCIVVTLLLVGLYGMFQPSWAGDPDGTWVSRIVSVQGDVLVKRAGEADWMATELDDTLYGGDQIRVEANGRAGIVLSNDAFIRLDQNTTLFFTEIEQPTNFVLKLLKGAAQFFSRRPHHLEVVTPFVNGVVEGTEFFVQVDDRQTRIDLFEGRVKAVNAWGEIQLAKGHRATAMAQQPPRSEILVYPRDSVQWALYYPPILAAGPGKGHDELGNALALSGRGQTAEALSAMNDIPENRRDARYYAFRAGLLLKAGRVDSARDDIRQSLALDGANSDAVSLKAIVAVVQNHKQEALESAQEAVRLGPRSATARIALSYAYQAVFDLTQALSAALEAVAGEPENAIAWARVAELRLSTGQLEKGVNAAQKAAELNPDLAHAQTILGFAYLTRIETGKAQEAFDKAIALDSAAPLPRLGLGLATIRDGHLEEGRAQIEIAVGLDPDNALIRSYLGKAYFEEKREPLDDRQFEIAKTLDPNDPTPWFYDAIRKQTLNRPVEALQDLQKSIELNDNRAVYRSRLLLDEDLAARSAALGRIYNDLSFQEQALRAGAQSLRSDPTNFSAHRLLSDIYATRPRHEIAQVSELLQSQLLQPLNLRPVQPQLAESSLTAPESVTSLQSSFDEFGQLFTRDRATLEAAGLVGNNSTWSDEATLAGLQQWVSYSLGQFHYETEGFRPNNDLEKDVTDAFIQAALSPRTSIQVEYRRKEVSHGDLELRFDPEDFSDTKKVSREEKIPRLGFHYAADVRNHFIASLIFKQTDYSLYQEQAGGPGPFGPLIGIEDRNNQDDSYNAEGQYVYQGNAVNYIIGAGYYRQNVTETVSTMVTSGPITLADNPNQRQDFDIWHSNAYAYSHFKLLPVLDVTMGLSADSYNNEELEVTQVNPKLGLNYYLSPSVIIRSAAFRSLKRTLVSNQTIEPTQIAGFTQFFDDYTATDAKRYGIGLDYQITNHLSAGAEMTYSDMTFPIVDPATSTTRDEEYAEYHHRFYVYWLAHPQIAVSTEYLFDHYERDPLPADVSRPYLLRTQTLPVTVSWFHDSGFFVKARGTYIHQRIESLQSAVSPATIEHDNFTLMDVGVGYRLPKRYGIVTFSVSNLFDTDFNYQDTNFLTADEQDPAIKPERQYYLKTTLQF